MVSISVGCEKSDQVRMTLIVEPFECHGFAIFFVAAPFLRIIYNLQLLDCKVSVILFSLIGVSNVQFAGNVTLTVSVCAL